jgi:hypothetical protein
MIDTTRPEEYETEYHPYWAQYENMRRGRTKATPEELESARLAAKKEAQGQLYAHVTYSPDLLLP